MPRHALILSTWPRSRQVRSHARLLQRRPGSEDVSPPAGMHDGQGGTGARGQGGTGARGREAVRGAHVIRGSFCMPNRTMPGMNPYRSANCVGHQKRFGVSHACGIRAESSAVDWPGRQQFGRHCLRSSAQPERWHVKEDKQGCLISLIVFDAPRPPIGRSRPPSTSH